MLTILMPVYNGLRFLPESINSILRQTFKDFTLLIIDDGSTEAVPELVRRYAAHDSRVRLLQNKKNIGLTCSLNVGLKATRGQYIGRHDGDDICAPTRFEKQMAAFSPGIGVVTCWAHPIAEDGGPYKKEKCYERVARHNSVTTVSLLRQGKHAAIDASAIYHPDVFEKIGYYDERLTIGQSYNYMLRAIRFFTLSVVQEPLYFRRKHSDTVTARLRKRKGPRSAQGAHDLCVAYAQTRPVIK